MAGSCAHNHCSNEEKSNNSPAWRQALWIALAVNGIMFLAEIIAGAAAGSASLQADALDFLGDTANYAISLGVAGLGLAWRARAALVKGWAMTLLGFWVIGAAIWHAMAGTLPAASTMSIVGIVALIANVAVALVLYRFREGDSNMRSVWICSRNDAIGNIAVIAAAGGVFGMGSGWPDIAVASIMALLGIGGGWQVIHQARRELSPVTAPVHG